MSKQDLQVFTIADTPVRQNAEGMVSLTNLWTISGATKMNPYEWSRKEGSQFIEFVAENLNTPVKRIIKGTRGKGGGTFSHPNIALAYAKYLSPSLHNEVNTIFLRAKSGDVTLAAEISDKATPEQQEWLAKRTAGKVIRNQLTATLSTHGVVGKGYADATNAIYIPLLDATKKEICERRGVPVTVNLRDTFEQLFEQALKKYAPMLASDIAHQLHRLNNVTMDQDYIGSLPVAEQKRIDRIALQQYKADRKRA